MRNLEGSSVSLMAGRPTGVRVSRSELLEHDKHDHQHSNREHLVGPNHTNSVDAWHVCSVISSVAAFAARCVSSGGLSKMCSCHQGLVLMLLFILCVNEVFSCPQSLADGICASNGAGVQCCSADDTAFVVCQPETASTGSSKAMVQWCPQGAHD